MQSLDEIGLVVLDMKVIKSFNYDIPISLLSPDPLAGRHRPSFI